MPSRSETELGSRRFVHELLDADSFCSWDGPLPQIEHGYRERLLLERDTVGIDEAVSTGIGAIDGHPVAVIVGEFAFLGGSLGVNASRRVRAAIERATVERMPLVLAPASGGTRMQEGTTAFLQMLPITQAIALHRESGLLCLAYLRNPTMGGVLASWASLGHVTIAEPGARLGFLGPRVRRALGGETFDTDVQTSECKLNNGVIDAVADTAQLREKLCRLLRVTSLGGGHHRRRNGGSVTARPPHADGGATCRTRPDAWASVLLTRQPSYPGAVDLLDAATQDFVRLGGRSSGSSSLIMGFARFGDRPAIVIALDRHAQARGARLGPEEFITARRGMDLAEQLRLPLVTVIDTPGADLTRVAEERDLAGEIALCLERIIRLGSPTLAVLLGQGAGGAALALLPADRVIAAEHAWLAPLPPEGASAIVHRSPDHAAELAASGRITATELAADGVIDDVIAGRPGTALSTSLGIAIHGHLGELDATDATLRLGDRVRRYRLDASISDVDDLRAHREHDELALLGRE